MESHAAAPSRSDAALGLNARLGQRIHALEAWAVPSGLGDPRSRQRCRLMARFSVLIVAANIAFAPLFWLTYPDADVAVVNVLYTVLPLATLWILRRSTSPETGAHWLIANAFAVLVYETVILGGVESPAFLWLASLPLAGSLFGGRRCAVFWGWAVGLCLAALIALEIQGATGDGSLESTMVINRGLSVALLALTIGYFGWLQDREITGLIHHLDTERAFFRRAATRDPLTGLLNRAELDDRLRQLLARTRRRGTTAALLYGDLNGFKVINDERGHAVGDLLLKGVAERLRSQTRASDTLMRVGGDEFVILVEEIPEFRGASALAEKIVELVSHPFLIKGIELSVGMSFGIVMIEGQDVRPQALIDAADAAMYDAKRAGQTFRFG